MIKELSKKLSKLSKKNNFNISAAESCTGGLLSTSIIEVSGASNYFNAGLITYSNKAKNKILGVDVKTIKRFGAVSNETSLAMAKGLYKLTSSNLIVSITGVAGPFGGNIINPIGTVYFTFGIKEIDKKIKYITECKRFGKKSRLTIQKRSVSFALGSFIDIINEYRFD